jgi:hypothetical protein
MDHFAGLDVSVKETSVCIVDDTGKVVREVKVASEPEALLRVLTNPAYCGAFSFALSRFLFLLSLFFIAPGACRPLSFKSSYQ